MIATGELRRLLDERGVEYRADDGKTVWATHWEFDKHSSAMFSEYDDGECVFVTSGHSWTPEQAVAATLGSDDRYDAGFASGVLAVFQQLEGIEDYEGLQDLIADYLGEGEEK